MSSIVQTLSNDLVVIYEPNQNSTTSGIAIFIKTGARDESPQLSGVSHFLEHMMFKGCEKYTSEEINYVFGDIGAQSNAFTSEEVTAYYAHVLPRHLEEAVRIHAEMFRPLFASEAFETERKVILEELAVYEDKPAFVLLEKALRDFFGEHPAGNTVIGTRESLNGLTPQMMKNYFASRYVPSNSVAVLTGKFDLDHMKRVMEESFGCWSGKSADRTLTPRTKVFGGYKLQKEGLNHIDIAFFTDGPSASDPDRIPLGLITSILGGSDGSRLYRALVEPGYAESASVDYDDRDGLGIVMAEAECSLEEQERVCDIMRKIVYAPPSFTEEELYRAKKRLKTRAVFGGELPVGRLMFLGNEWIYRNRTLDLKETLDEIEKVNIKAIKNVLEKYPLSQWSEYSLSPNTH